MVRLTFRRECCNRRRAVVAVQVGIVLIVLLGFAALTVDVGTLYNTRNDLQRTADAAALAGASMYTTDAMMQIRQGSVGSDSLATLLGQVGTRVHEYAGMNLTFGTDAATRVADGDIATEDYVMTFQGETNLNTKDISIDLDILLADKYQKIMRDRIGRNVERGLSTSGTGLKYVKSDRVTDLVMKKMVNEEGKLFITYKVAGSMNKPSEPFELSILYSPPKGVS